MHGDRLKIAAVGVCTGVSVLLLAIAYLPGFFPEGYKRLRQNRVIYLVPVAIVVEVVPAVGWLYLKHKENDNA